MAWWLATLRLPISERQVQGKERGSRRVGNATLPMRQQVAGMPLRQGSTPITSVRVTLPRLWAAAALGGGGGSRGAQSPGRRRASMAAAASHYCCQRRRHIAAWRRRHNVAAAASSCLTTLLRAVRILDSFHLRRRQHLIISFLLLVMQNMTLCDHSWYNTVWRRPPPHS